MIRWDPWSWSRRDARLDVFLQTKISPKQAEQRLGSKWLGVVFGFEIIDTPNNLNWYSEDLKFRILDQNWKQNLYRILTEM